MSDVTLLLVHAAATLLMTGLIWFVQVVHYPLMAWIGDDAFLAHHAQHVRRTTWIVGPLMLCEAATALLLALGPIGEAAPAITGTGLALVAVIWLSTAALQMPCHRGLRGGYDRHLVRRLVATNWLRTGAWTARSALALALLLPAVLRNSIA